MHKNLAMTDKRVTARRQALAFGAVLVLLGGCATQRVIAPPPTPPGAKAAYHSITIQPAHLAAVTAHPLATRAALQMLDEGGQPD